MTFSAPEIFGAPLQQSLQASFRSAAPKIAPNFFQERRSGNRSGLWSAAPVIAPRSKIANFDQRGHEPKGPKGPCLPILSSIVRIVLLNGFGTYKKRNFSNILKVYLIFFIVSL